MPFKMMLSKPSETCQLHGSSRTANKTLILMILASLLLIVWHVWLYGPTSRLTQSEPQATSFPLLVGSEILDLLFNKHGIIAELWDVFPYFIVGILLAGYLRTFKFAAKLQAKLRKYGVLSVFLAAFIGIMTPLCACGTLTTAVSLLFAGIPLAPIMALLVTSPLLSPSTYLLTLNDLGPEWTAIRTIAAFSMGIIAGMTTHLLTKRGFQTDDIFIEGGITKGDFHDADYPDERLRCNCKERFGNRVALKTGNKFLIFLAKSSEMLWMVGKYVIVGVALGTIVERYMPSDWIYSFFGNKDPLNIIWVTLASVPMFLHQVSASSLLYHIKSALPGTIDGGAALAFMIGGPVTAMPTMVLFWTIFKKRVFCLYMTVCLAGTIIIAYAFQLLVFVPGVDTGNPLLAGVASLSRGRSSIIQKQNQHVRIVMDPDGNNIIATYSNDIEGHGGVVFDADISRFRDGATGRHDNRQYIANVAGWLGQNNSSSAEKQILIYNTSHEAGHAGQAFSNLPGILAGAGFAVTVTDRWETPEIAEPLLADYGQIWIIFGETNADRSFTDVELEIIQRFVGTGKSLLLVAGDPRNGTYDLSTENRLATQFGVRFAGYVESREALPASIASQTFNTMAELFGSILRLVDKA